MAMSAIFPMSLRSLPSKTASVLYVRRRQVALFLLILTAILIVDVTQRERHAFAILSFIGLNTTHKITEPKFPPLAHGCSSDLLETSLHDKTLACANFPSHLLGTTQIIIKVGAAEIDKTKGLLNTVALCIPNVLLVSDADDVVDGHEVIDVLADLPPSYADDNPDWQAYLDQKSALAAGKKIHASNAGWKLDRFKFLPMIEKAFERAPDAHWYIFIETDIYYFWDTAFRLLGTLDHTEYHYLGAPTPAAAGLYFVYGGGGIILSGRLVRDLLKDGRQKISEKYEQLAKDDCCGDAVLTYAIYRELGIRMEGLSPTFSAADPAWVPVNQANWCTPLLGFHRVSPERAMELWEWERCRPYTEQPITYSSYLDFILAPNGDVGSKSNWDTGPGHRLPDKSPAHRSAHACARACDIDASCLQYRFAPKDGGCSLANWVTHGVAVDGSKGEVISGRSLEHLEELGFALDKNPGSSCQQTEWLVPKIMYPG